MYKIGSKYTLWIHSLNVSQVGFRRVTKGIMKDDENVAE